MIKQQELSEKKKILMNYSYKLCIMTSGGIFLPKVNAYKQNVAILIAFVIFFLSSLNLNCNDFILKPTRLFFYGAVSSGTNIIVYASYGAYLMSTDFGRSWQQHSVDLYGDIRDIKNYNDTLWGIVDNGYIIKSTDNGFNWHKQRIEVKESEKFLRLIVTEDALFIRGIQTVWRFNKNLQLVNYIENILFEPHQQLCYDQDWEFNYYNLDQFYYVFDKILLASSKFWHGFWAISKDLNSFEQINIKDKVKTWNPASHTLYKVHLFKGIPVFQINLNLYFADSTFSNWKYFFENTYFMNDEDSIIRAQLRPSKLLTGSYFFNKDSLFAPFLSDSVDTNDPQRPIYYWEGIGIKKYVSNPIDTFVQVGNVFKDVYNTNSRSLVFTKYSGGIDIYLKHGFYLSHTPYCFFDSVWVICSGNSYYDCGYSRMFVISPDNFKTWKLVSYLSGKPRFILNDSTFFFCRADYAGFLSTINEICRTTDGGITFHPWKAWVEGDSGIKRIRGYTDYQLFYIDSTGRGFIKGQQILSPQQLVETRDFWDTYDKKNTNLGSFYLNFSTNICRIGDTLLFATSDTTRTWAGSKKYFTRIYYTDTSFNQFNNVEFDSLIAIYHILPNGKINDFLAFCIVNDSANPFIDYFEIQHTLDTGKTFRTILRMEESMKINQIYEHNADSIFITFKNPNRLYLYRTKQNKMDLLWESEDYQDPMLMYLGGKFYLVGRELFLENTDRRDLTKWQKGRWDYGTPTFESLLFKGNVAIAGLRDSLRPFNYYRITPKQTATRVEENKVEVRYYSSRFWASPAYPMPAQTFVRAKIYWDMSFDLEEAITGVYNIYGKKIEGRENIIINHLGNSSVELTWDCTGISDGIYFIVVNHSGRTDCVPVIINK